MMESRRWQSTAAAAAAAEAAEEDTGGAGGPSRRPARRGMHRASPYGGGPRRWLTRLPVASRIFPTMPRYSAPSDNNQDVHRESLDLIPETQSMEPKTNVAAVEPLAHVSNQSNHLMEGDRNPGQSNGIADLENMFKQRHFSRDETERLIDIMRSRTPDLSFEDQRAPGFATEGFETTPFSTRSKLIDPQSSWGTDALPPSNVHATIEIAKAFMEAQTSASVHESQKRKFIALSHGVEAENTTSKVFPKVAIDSPGYTNYLTPESNKRRPLPQPHSRTPYGGSVFRRSIKNSRHGDTYNNSSGRSQLSTPFSIGSKNSSHGDTCNNSSGRSQLSTPFSIGSKTTLEGKFASTSGNRVQPSSCSRGQVDVFGSNTSFFPQEGSAATKNTAFNPHAPDGKGTIESRTTSGHASAVDNISRCASVSVHPKSSETAFKILQHLERTIPSPTLKPLELRHTLAKRNTSSVANKSQIRGPDFSIGNGQRQSGMNDTSSANLEIAAAKKVPPSSPSAEEPARKIQSSGANSEVPETRTSQQPLKSDSTSTSAAVASDKNTSKGFTFTFPVPKAPSSLFEPPPTPTLGSPPRTLPIMTEDIPKFNFGSSSTANKLLFSFDSTSGSIGSDGTVPTFKFGSDKKRDLCFNLAGGKDTVCF